LPFAIADLPISIKSIRRRPDLKSLWKPKASETAKMKNGKSTMANGKWFFLPVCAFCAFCGVST
jgi:hypothetical protein